MKRIFAVAGFVAIASAVYLLERPRVEIMGYDVHKEKLIEPIGTHSVVTLSGGGGGGGSVIIKYQVGGGGVLGSANNIEYKER